MSAPIYQGPPINENVPWDIRHHLQQIYTKLGFVNQAFALQNEKIAAAESAATSASSTTVKSASSGASGPLSVIGGGTGSVSLPTEVLLGNGASPIKGAPSVSPGYVLTDDGPSAFPAFTFPFVSAPQYKYANLPASPTLGQVVCVTDANVNTWSAVISSGGGTHFVLAWFQGAQWTVIGI